MSKLLVAFDGSENAMRALRYAIGLAKEQAALALHVVHAHEAPLVYGELGLYVSNEKLAELQREHSARVLDGAEKVLKEAAVPYTKEILAGPVA
ncbi:MAG: universal stress protein, partial [Burkholderiales bacterium]